MKPAEVDLIASQTLANAKTAEEYVSKALEMKTKYDHTTPSSSFVKYDIYEGEKTKLLPVTVISENHNSHRPVMSSTAAPKTEPIGHEDAVSDNSKSASEYVEFYSQHQPEYYQTTTTTTYKHPEFNNYKDLESSNSDYNHQFSSYDHFNPSGLHSVYPSKQEMISYIEKAVKKYLRELDLTGKLTGAPSAQAEIKTYYRFPSTTTPTPIPIGNTKLFSAGTHSEFFKPAKDSYLKSSYSTVKPFAVDSIPYVPESVDLTVRSKKRPKPIDLSALDVGQSCK